MLRLRRPKYRTCGADGGFSIDHLVGIIEVGHPVRVEIPQAPS